MWLSFLEEVYACRFLRQLLFKWTEVYDLTSLIRTYILVRCLQQIQTVKQKVYSKKTSKGLRLKFINLQGSLFCHLMLNFLLNNAISRFYFLYILMSYNLMCGVFYLRIGQMVVSANFLERDCMNSFSSRLLYRPRGLRLWPWSLKYSGMHCCLTLKASCRFTSALCHIYIRISHNPVQYCHLLRNLGGTSKFNVIELFNLTNGYASQSLPWQDEPWYFFQYSRFSLFFFCFESYKAMVVPPSMSLEFDCG